MKKFLLITLSALLFIMTGCNKKETIKNVNDVSNQTTEDAVQLEVIKKDINFSNNMPISLCYDGYIIYFSNEGNGYCGIYTYDGKEILPFGNYSISSLLNSYVQVSSRTEIDGIYPTGIYNVKTKKWLFEQSVDLVNGNIIVLKNNNYLKVIIDEKIEYYDENGKKIDTIIAEDSINLQNTPEYLSADWEADPLNNRRFAVINKQYGQMTDYIFRNVTSFDGGFYNGIALFTDEIKPDVDRQGIISSMGKILVEPQYLNVNVSNEYVLGIKTSTTADLYKIIYN